MARLSRRGHALLRRTQPAHVEHDSPQTLLFLAAVVVALGGPVFGPLDGWVVYVVGGIALLWLAMFRFGEAASP